MKLLLCSDFTGVGYRYLNKIFKTGKNLNCLFVGYAHEKDDEMLLSDAKIRFLNFGFNVIDLTQDYDFKDKIDVIFVRGGNTTKLIHYLKKYNQFEKIKNLVKSGVVYIGNSAGAILVGNDTEWTLEAEPYSVDLKNIYGCDALKGFGILNKMIFVHCSKYRLCWDCVQKGDDIYRILDLDCYPAYLKDIKKYSKDQFVRIGNNQALFIDDAKQKMFTYNWSKIPVKYLECDNL